MSKNMSQREINTRKKVQAHISQTTGTLGLAGLGALALSSKKLNPGALKAVAKLPAKVQPKIVPHVTRDSLKGKSLASSVAAGGIGGAGSFNFASYSAAEAKQRKKATVKKNDGVSAFGVEH